MRQLLAILAVAALSAGLITSVEAHCGKCDKDKSERSTDIVSELQKAGGCSKDKNTTSSDSFCITIKQKSTR